MARSKLATLFVIVFVDLFGFGIILPLVPYYGERFGADAGLIGLLVASYAAMQFFSSPFLSRLSDIHGRRPILMLSILGTGLGFVIMGFAGSLAMLFASRILDGITGGNISVAQAYISDVTDDKSRAQGLGIIGAAFGLGFIMGPATGGILSKWSMTLPAFVAAALAGLNLVAVYFLLPESLPPEKRGIQAAGSRRAFSFSAFREALSRKLVGPLLNVRFLYRMAFGTFEGIFVLYALYRFGLSADKTSYILAYVGVLIVLVQGLAIGRLTARFRENHLIFGGFLLLGLSLISWAYAPTVTILLVVLAPLALSGGVLNTVINSSLSKVVHADEIGGILGISSSLDSLSRVISPALGGYLLEHGGTWAPGLFGSVLLVLFLPYAWKKILGGAK